MLQLRLRILCKIVLTLLLTTGPAVSVRAQSFQLEPITLDISANSASSNSDLELQVAYTPLAIPPRLARSPGSTPNAVRTIQGRPQPSIIIGLIDPGAEASFGVDGLLTSTIARYQFNFDDRETREALRSSDPDLFRDLVEGGHVDPPDNQLVTALQTELARMKCYRSGIDGQWGGGSRGSVNRYFKALDNGTNWSERDPSNTLFRAILINGDATCQVAAASSPSTARTRRQNTSQPATTPQPSTPRPSNAPRAPLGVFR